MPNRKNAFKTIAIVGGLVVAGLVVSESIRRHDRSKINRHRSAMIANAHALQEFTKATKNVTETMCDTVEMMSNADAEMADRLHDQMLQMKSSMKYMEDLIRKNREDANRGNPSTDCSQVDQSNDDDTESSKH